MSFESVEISKLLLAFGLTMIAGLATGIGSVLAFFTKHTNTKFLSAALGFSAGVMMFVSFVELLPESRMGFSEMFGEKPGFLYMLFSFFGGIALIMIIDFMIPKEENPHETHKVEEMQNKYKLKRMGTMIALSIAIHNFPEGLATFVAAMDNLEIAIPIVVAIAIHNIPEGIAVSIPIYHATGDRKKAFRLSLLSGMAEPVGALVGWLILMPFWTPTINNIILAGIAGIMVFISLDELLPSAEKYGEHHLSISGVLLGMVVMAVSLYML
ncbi:MAG: zinc transporter ZupT [Bacteroidales bacterium]